MRKTIHRKYLAGGEYSLARDTEPIRLLKNTNIIYYVQPV